MLNKFVIGVNQTMSALEIWVETLRCAQRDMELVKNRLRTYCVILTDQREGRISQMVFYKHECCDLSVLELSAPLKDLILYEHEKMIT